MFLWDSNILRHFGEKHPNLAVFLKKTPWSEIALPSVVVAEVLRGRCEYALKADFAAAPMAHYYLMETQKLINHFRVIVFDEKSAGEMEKLRKKYKSRKRYADMMIAATALAGNHIVVTRNLKDFRDMLPQKQLVNWIDSECGL